MVVVVSSCFTFHGGQLGISVRTILVDGITYGMPFGVPHHRIVDLFVWRAPIADPAWADACHTPNEL
jgi:hypothetical protein